MNIIINYKIQIDAYAKNSRIYIYIIKYYNYYNKNYYNRDKCSQLYLNRNNKNNNIKKNRDYKDRGDREDYEDYNNRSN